MSDFPIPIRTDCVVFVCDVPYDLTKEEAQKIADVVLALVDTSTNEIPND